MHSDVLDGLSHALKNLKSDGMVMIVEPFANDKTEDNLNPIGRLLYGASTMVCVLSSMASNGPALGAPAGESRIGEVVRAGGLQKVQTYDTNTVQYSVRGEFISQTMRVVQLRLSAASRPMFSSM